MKVVPLAADSLGVRSVATWVECGDTRVLIDPGATLAASRFGLPPGEAEWEALRRANERIGAYAASSTLVFVSHYHEDHFRYDPALYAGRGVWAKDPRRGLGPRQRLRAAELWKGIQGVAAVSAADSRCVETRDAVLEVSPPLPHGLDGTALGQLVVLTITDRRDGFRFIHASDLQGPVSPVAAAYLVRQRPNLLYVSGPPAYLEGQVGRPLIERGIENLLGIVARTGCRVIMDHHALRDGGWRERFARLWETGRVATAAAFLGVEEAPLEAGRRRLWGAGRKPPAPIRTAGRRKGVERPAAVERRAAFGREKGGRAE